MVEAQLQNVRAMRLLQSNQEPPPPMVSVELDQETLEAVNNLMCADPSLRFWPITMTPPPAPPPSPAIVSTPKKATRSRSTKQAKTPSTKALKNQTAPSRNSKAVKRKITNTQSIHTQPNTSSSSVACSSTSTAPSQDSINFASINSSLLGSTGLNNSTFSPQSNVTCTTASTSTASASTSYLTTTTLVGNGIFPDSLVITQFSQIMFLFSQIFDFVIVPSLTFSSSLLSNPLGQSLAAGSAQNDPTILIFLYRQIIFTEFQNSLKDELLVHYPPGSASASLLTIDKMLSIFCSSCRKLGINL